MWFLCPVLIYHEVVAVPKEASSIRHSVHSTCWQHRIILNAKKRLAYAGQRNVVIYVNAMHLAVMMLKFVIYHIKLQ
jgi:hypothetical protein